MPTPELTNLGKDDIERLRKLAMEDLFVFAKGVLGFDWLTPHIHLPLCRLLENYRKNKRLMIVLPRGWLKTTLCSQAYPLWRGIRDSNVRVMLVQNTFTNACSKLDVIAGMVDKNPLFRTLFPEVLPEARSRWKSESRCLRRTRNLDASTFEAAGTRTQVTSRHYNVIIEDDTVAPDLDDLGQENLCPTKVEVDQAIGWHRIVPPLLVNPSQDQILVVGTRWFEKDLISWIKANDPTFVVYERSCREDKDGKSSESGEVTYPERFDAPALESLRNTMGPYLFSCLYLNKPIRSKDMIFQPEWIRYYETPPLNLICTTTVDPAGDPEDTKGEADWNVVLTVGKDLETGLIYVLEYTRKRCSPGELLTDLFRHVRTYHPVKVGLETTQYQKSLKYWIRERQRKESTHFLVESLTHTRKSKNARIMGLQPLLANGALRFRPHMKALINELIAFPYGEQDDVLDALASQLELLQATVSLSEQALEFQDIDPFDFSVAVKEITQRHERTKTKKYYDLVSPTSRLELSPLESPL